MLRPKKSTSISCSAAAGAAIALAVNQTHGAALTWSQTPLGGATLFWALSFVFGCKHLQYVAAILYANFSLLRVQSGCDREVGTSPQRMVIASEGIRNALDTNGNRAVRYARWQFQCLIAGAVLYIAWHVFEMYLRT
jgi:hypothetical protein